MRPPATNNAAKLIVKNQTNVVASPALNNDKNDMKKKQSQNHNERNDGPKKRNQHQFERVTQSAEHLLRDCLILQKSGQLGEDKNLSRVLVQLSRLQVDKQQKTRPVNVQDTKGIPAKGKGCKTEDNVKTSRGTPTVVESCKSEDNVQNLKGTPTLGQSCKTEDNVQISEGTPTMGASCKTEDKLKEIDAIISAIVGLEGIKLQLRKWVKGLVLYEKRKTLGLNVGTRKALHMVFLGNPGTGKTMVARVLGKILHKLGLISADKVTEVQRTDLVSEFIGKTGLKTREKIEEAKGGILFVDEAYRLMPKTEKDFGGEALEEIMTAMDNGNIIIIFAGYSSDMERVICLNPGFTRRVGKFFHFNDYSPTEIATILQSKFNTQDDKSFVLGFKLHSDYTVTAMAQLIKEHIPEKLLKIMNGGLVDPLLVNALENLDLRSDTACSNADTLITITMEDLEEGLKSVSELMGKSDDRYLHMYC